MYNLNKALSDSFCVPRAGEQEQTRLVLLEPDTVEYLQVKVLLKSEWNHKTKHRPELIRVFKILRSTRSYETYYDYQDKIHIQLLLLSTKDKRVGAVESLLFHGTRRTCLLGEDDGQISICSSPQCSLCRIIESSFDVARCGSHHKFSRFGKAIYTTSCSSKADDYSSSTHPEAKSRILLLNRVLAGREFVTRENSTELIKPPDGYHSVTGEPGVHLNYEETVIYNNDAIRPAYLIVYVHKRPVSFKERIRRFLQIPIV